MEGKDISERRRFKRLSIDLHVEVDEVFKQDHIVIKDLNASVEVFDISKAGIGFVSNASLPLGYYFRARINLGDGEFFYTVIRIVRAHISEENKMVYGAEFIGLAPFLADKVDLYETRLNETRINK